MRSIQIADQGKKASKTFFLEESRKPFFLQYVNVIVNSLVSQMVVSQKFKICRP